MVLEQGSKLESSYHLKKCIVRGHKADFKALIFKQDNKFYLFHNNEDLYYVGIKPINFIGLSIKYDYKFSYQLNYHTNDLTIDQMSRNEKIIFDQEEDLELWF